MFRRVAFGHFAFASVDQELFSFLQVAGDPGPCGKDDQQAYQTQNRSMHFLLLGAQKSGTSTLAGRLLDHPAAEEGRGCDQPNWEATTGSQSLLNEQHWSFLGKFQSRKEKHWFLHEFQDEWLNTNDVADAEKKYFAMWHDTDLSVRDPGERRADFTPYYLYDPRVAKRIKWQLGGHTRFVAVLREPIARAYSSWVMNIGQGSVLGERPFEEVIGEELKDLDEGFANHGDEFYEKMFSNHDQPNQLLGIGLYYYQFVKYFELFDPCHFFIMDNYDINKKGNDQSLYSFLDMQPANYKTDAVDTVVGQRKSLDDLSEIIGHPMMSRLKNFYSKHNGKLFKLLGKDFDWGY